MDFLQTPAQRAASLFRELQTSNFGGNIYSEIAYRLFGSTFTPRDRYNVKSWCLAEAYGGRQFISLQDLPQVSYRDITEATIYLRDFSVVSDYGTAGMLYSPSNKHYTRSVIRAFYQENRQIAFRYWREL